MDTLLQLFVAFWLLCFAVGVVFCTIGIVVSIIGALAPIVIPIAVVYFGARGLMFVFEGR